MRSEYVTSPTARRLTGLSVVVGVLAALSGCKQPEAKAPPEFGLLPQGAKKPNIIFILVDTLRADRLGVYGSTAKLTPTMDQIGREGVVFDRCFAPAPWTLPSVASMFVSYYPSVHKATEYEIVEGMDQGRIAKVAVLDNEKFETMAGILRSGGYETAGFVANKFLKADYGFAKGFSHYDTSFSGNTVHGDVVNAAATKWLDEGRASADKPLFLYLHYMDVHGPYNAAPEFMDPLLDAVENTPMEKRTALKPQQIATLNPYLNRPPVHNGSVWDKERFEALRGYLEYWRARYDAGVAEMDSVLAKMISELDKRGLWKDSLVILASDHGEALCEHGFWEHGYSMMQTDLHVPLVIRWPEILPAGSRVMENVSLIDLLPTMATQLRMPLEANFQGRSLVGAMARTPLPKPVLIFAEAVKAGPTQHAIVEGDWKLMRWSAPDQTNPDGTTKPGPRQHFLMNLKDDPLETTHQGGADTRDILIRLNGSMDTQISVNATIAPDVVVKMGEGDAAELRAVGYTGGGSGKGDAAEPAPATQPAKSDGD